MPERLDELERQQPGPQDPRATVGAERIVHRAVGEDVQDATVGLGEVHLDVVGLPLIRDGFDADPGEPDLSAVVPDPDVDGLPHLGIVRLRGEDELALLVEPTGQIDHPAHPRIGAAASRHAFGDSLLQPKLSGRGTLPRRPPRC